MCLVSGDQENLSSMPRGIKIISELQDIEWKQRADGFASADMCHSLHGDAPPVVDTSTHQPTQTGVWQEKKPKTLFSSGPRVLWPAHGPTLAEGNALELCEGMQCHSQPAPPPPPPHCLVTGRVEVDTQKYEMASLNLLLHARVRDGKCDLTGNTHTDTHLEVEHWAVWWDSSQPLAQGFPHTHLYVWLKEN